MPSKDSWQRKRPSISPGEEARGEWNKIIQVYPQLKGSYPIYLQGSSLLIITEREYISDLSSSLSILRLINKECGYTFRSIKFKAKTDLLSTKEIVLYLKDVFGAKEVSDEDRR